MANRFLNDQNISLYNPNQNFKEEKLDEFSQTSSNKKRKNPIQQSNHEMKNKKKLSIKEYYLQHNLLVEENLEEKFCICRFDKIFHLFFLL